MEIVSQEDTKLKSTSSFSSGAESSSTMRLDDYLLYDQFLESEVNHSPLLPSMVCQSPLFKDILHPTLPPSQNMRFIGPAIIETDQIEKNSQSFGKDSVKEKLLA